MRSARLIIYVLAYLSFLTCAAVSTRASTITFTETTTAPGSLDGTSFSNGSITLTVVADTSNLTNPEPGVFYIAGTGTVSVAGVGSDTLIDTIIAVVNQHNPSAGISDQTHNFAILFTTGAVFSSYDLISPIGPISGAADGNPFLTFPTTGGSFSINSLTTATFTAVGGVSATPEPGSLFLLLTGIAGMLGARSRVRR